MLQKRNIVLDTETTGLSIKEGHRIIEIGCVELINDQITGSELHLIINPDRPIPMSSVQIHGITDDIVVDKPKFNEIADVFLDFIKDSTLIIHNAQFDMNFLNYELNLIGKKKLSDDRALDTLDLARKNFPGQKASLDALCKKFDISLKTRKMHGALIDAKLLTEVYFCIKQKIQIQNNLDFYQNNSTKTQKNHTYNKRKAMALSIEDEANHRDFIKKNITNAIWFK